MVGSELIVVIPAHNEAATIGAVVAGARLHARVIVVDDGSTDDTGAIAEAAGAQIIRNRPGLGYDGALQAGAAAAVAAGARAVVTMDADGEHAPELVADFRRLLLQDKVPLVLGVRPRKQRLAEYLVGWYCRWRWGIRDILCGMKGFDVALYHQNGGLDHVRGVNMELALTALSHGHRFAQIPVYGTPRPDQPRFGRRWHANKAILAAFLRVLRRLPTL
ncbi:MAG TPA: glycosyltransferase family 2 protein [Magnetospirillum sp.]|nr:glycosyltransferase family 2 protein [Magnetospirillum sp.]